MSETIVLAHLAGKRIALSASAIESIVEVDEITPVPRAPAYIEGLSSLRSQALTVVNCAKFLRVNETPRDSDEPAQAAVVKRDGQHFALLLDRVDDVVELDAEPEAVLGGVGDGWSDVALGNVEIGNGSALLVDVEAFTTHQQGISR